MAPSFADLPSPPAPSPTPKEPGYTPPPFSPSVHLNYQPPTHTLSFDDLHLTPTNPTSPIAITHPFPLLTQAAIRALRADLFRPSLLSRHASWKYPGVYRIRGYGPAAPFTYALWKSEEIRQACSHAAGVELEVIMDYEIGQANVQLPESVDLKAPIIANLPPADPPAPSRDMDTSASAPPNTDGTTPTQTEKPLVSAWHRDSYPYVCVLMLSNPDGMKGGETALRPGSTHPSFPLVKIKPPQLGYAVMMQGGAIEHAALPCLGGGERITLVTSFRAKNSGVGIAGVDGSLRTVRPISRLGGLYTDWSGYRLQVLEERVGMMRGMMEEMGRKAREEVEKDEGDEKLGCESWNGRGGEDVRDLMRRWVAEQIEFLQRTAEEIV